MKYGIFDTDTRQVARNDDNTPMIYDDPQLAGHDVKLLNADAGRTRYAVGGGRTVEQIEGWGR